MDIAVIGSVAHIYDFTENDVKSKQKDLAVTRLIPRFHEKGESGNRDERDPEICKLGQVRSHVG